jgi:hypothetical protein
LTDDGKKGSSIINPLPRRIKKNRIMIESKKVADLSDNIEMVIKILPKTRIKIDE